MSDQRPVSGGPPRFAARPGFPPQSPRHEGQLPQVPHYHQQPQQQQQFAQQTQGQHPHAALLRTASSGSSGLQLPRDSFADAISIISAADLENTTNAEVMMIRAALGTSTRSSQSSDDQHYSSLEHSASTYSMGQLRAELTSTNVSPRQFSSAPMLPVTDPNQKYKRQFSMGSFESTGSDAESDRAQHKSSASVASASIVLGEHRLKIVFEEYGTLGQYPQRFGKSGLWIADGLTGTHDMYEQSWRFHIRIGPPVNDDACIVTWSITNTSSLSVTAVTETPKQAIYRQQTGRTICNKVVRDALAVRHAQLEELLNSVQDNSTRAANVRSLMSVISPRRCTVGLLFFGLLHQSVQQRLLPELEVRGLHAWGGRDDTAAVDDDDDDDL